MPRPCEKNVCIFRDGELICTFPELITLVNNETGIPITNNELEEWMNVDIYVGKSLPLWRTDKGRTVLSPRSVGIDINVKMLA